MCPACIATMTFLVAGSASTGGLTALATRKFRRKAGAKTITGNSQKTRAHYDKIEAEQPKTGFVEPVGQNELSKETESCCRTSVG